MDPPLAAPLRLRLDHANVPIPHSDASDMIRLFLQDYATRTSSSQAEGSTGGVIASQLTRLMNGLNGVIVEPPVLQSQSQPQEQALTAESPVPESKPEDMEVDEPTQPQEKVEEPSPKKEKKGKKEKKDKKDKKSS